jgi:hypothetical protein
MTERKTAIFVAVAAIVLLAALSPSRPRATQQPAPQATQQEELRPIFHDQTTVTIRDDTVGCKDYERQRDCITSFKSGEQVWIRDDLWNVKCISKLDNLSVCHWIENEPMCGYGANDRAKDANGLYNGEYTGICRKEQSLTAATQTAPATSTLSGGTRTIKPSREAIPQNKEAAAKAAAEIRRVGVKQYLYGVSVDFCKSTGSMTRVEERASYFSNCLPKTIKWCRETYDMRGFC